MEICTKGRKGPESGCMEWVACNFSLLSFASRCSAFFHNLLRSHIWSLNSLADDSQVKTRNDEVYFLFAALLIFYWWRTIHYCFSSLCYERVTGHWNFVSVFLYSLLVSFIIELCYLDMQKWMYSIYYQLFFSVINFLN